MTFGDKLFNVIASQRRPGEMLPKERWLAIVNEFVDVERPLDKDGKAKKPKRQTPINKMTDGEFMQFLHGEEHLLGIDIPREIGKCQFHFKAKGVVPSRMRIINWLNKADKTLALHGRGVETRQAAVAERSQGAPHGWQEHAKAKQRDWGQANGGDVNGTAEFAIQKGDFFALPESWRIEVRRRCDAR